jgi:hypothetical protein
MPSVYASLATARDILIEAGKERGVKTITPNRLAIALDYADASKDARLAVVRAMRRVPEWEVGIGISLEAMTGVLNDAIIDTGMARL